MRTHRLRVFPLFFAASAGLLATPALAVIRYVDDSAPNGGNGQSWGTAYNNLRTALTASVAGDELRVAQGTYKPGTLRTEAFALKEGVRIRGGYAGLGTINANARDPVAFPSILTGDLANNDGPNFANYADNSYVVVTAASTITASTELDGFIIQGGNADGAFGTQDRGGGFNCSGSPSISSCVFRRNSASGGGGMNVGSAGNPVLRDCQFLANRATGASAGFANGGGLNVLGNADVSGCFFGGNSAAGNGGGLATATSSNATKITNGVFTGNSAAQGAGIYVGGSTIINCTVSNNTATTAGGGIAAAPTTSPGITNCIVWGNALGGGAGGGESGHQLAGSMIVTYSCVQGGALGTGNIDWPPLFIDALGPDGLAGTIDDNLRIRPGPGIFSSCIDAGNRVAAEAMLTKDAAGGERFVDIPAVGDSGAGTGIAIDIGAYEATGASCNVDINHDGFVDPDDLADYIALYFGGCP